MNKNIVIGIVAFGGLLLAISLLSGPSSNKTSNMENIATEESLETAAAIANFPIYPGEIIPNQDVVGIGSRDITITVSTDADIKEINDWYRDAFSKGGWSIKSDRNVAGYQIIQAENGNLYTSMQAANATEPGKVTISQQIKIRK